MLELLTIVLAIALSNVPPPPQTVPGETQGPNVTAPGDQQVLAAIDPPDNSGGSGGH